MVQGVGFRPFVYILATRLGLSGLVKNQSSGLLIEVEGDVPALDQFCNQLSQRPPSLAKIQELVWRQQPTIGEKQFRIEASEADSARTIFVAPDVATCDACLAELFDPVDRRYRYPFLNCTNCGPRLTIITGAPYDRPLTTMAGFPMCPACRAEYNDPTNRRFHAQPTCCPECGPRLQLIPDGKRDPLSTFAATIRGGRIGAMKGLGGYHLVCDARNDAAVADLRRRKHRDEKPFAVMVVDLAAAELFCVVDDAERELLGSPRRPIVLLRKRPHSAIADSVAPGNPFLGVILPYTPLHHLLLREVGFPLVMTSGNRSDEPIAYEDSDAVHSLTGIADLFLVHNRSIHIRCDDSVTRVVGRVELPFRRSRGYAPQPINLPFECPRPILAVGGQLKATFALGRGPNAFLSHHLGDLDHYQAYKAFQADIELYEQLFAIRPEVIAHDLHPDYASTRYALDRAGSQLPTVAVQHHHAHMASCMAEHDLTEKVIGITFDGTGYGTDGAVWGGEFLVGDYQGFRRAAHLRYVGLPGRDAAVREPWRMALSHLRDAGVENSSLRARILPNDYRTIETMLERQFHTMLTSSVGRLFDAVASIIGIRDRVSCEGQAAVELEWLASNVAADGTYAFDLRPGEGADASLIIDTRPLIRSICADAAGGARPAIIGRRFHSTMAHLIVAVCNYLRAECGLSVVVLSGGVFLNALLTQEVSARLSENGFRVYRHRLAPPNDGGLSLGQLAVAAATVSRRIAES